MDDGLYRQIREAILRYGPAGDDLGLRSAFAGPLWAWRDELPEARSPSQRAELLISFLAERAVPGAKPGSALAYFLGALGDNLHEADAGRAELSELARRVESAIASGELQPPPSREVQATIPLDRLLRTEHFAGREREINAAVEALALGKVVTLWGAGGMGKTAIAAELLTRLSSDPTQPPERFRDGVVVCEFQGKRSGEGILWKIATAYGTERREGERIADTARRALRGRRALVVLDGAEYCDAKELEEVLHVCSSVAVLLITQRKSQSRGRRIDIERLPAHDAEAMLQWWVPERSQEQDAVERIVELVDGLPLALRIAGAYMEQEDESAARYLAWLEQQPFAALVGQGEMANISMLLERSAGRLTAPARTILGLVGAHTPAPFPREAVAYALAYNDVNEVRQPLGEMVDYGLLTAREGRYEASHRLVQMFAQQRMPAGADQLRRFGEFYLKQAQRIWGWWRETLTPWQSEPRETPGRGSPNLFQVIREFREVIEYCELGLALLRQTEGWRVSGTVLGVLGTAYWNLGDREKAINYWEEALELLRDAGDQQGAGILLARIGLTYYGRRDVQRAQRSWEAAIQLLEAAGSNDVERVRGYLERLEEKE